MGNRKITIRQRPQQYMLNARSIQWMLRLVSKKMARNTYLHSLQVSPQTIHVDCKEKNSGFTVEKLGTYHLNQVIKANTNWHHMKGWHIDILIWCTKMGVSLASGVLPRKTIPQSNNEKTKDHFKLRNIYKLTSPHQKCGDHERQKKIKDMSQFRED